MSAQIFSHVMRGIVRLTSTTGQPYVLDVAILFQPRSECFYRTPDRVGIGVQLRMPEDL